MAERGGFEPPIGYAPITVFESGFMLLSDCFYLINYFLWPECVRKCVNTQGEIVNGTPYAFLHWKVVFGFMEKMEVQNG